MKMSLDQVGVEAGMVEVVLTEVRVAVLKVVEAEGVMEEEEEEDEGQETTMATLPLQQDGPIP